MKTETTIPAGCGVCPVCEGKRYLPVPKEHLGRSVQNPCPNCSARHTTAPRGYVLLRPDGTPCTHTYDKLTFRGKSKIFTCGHCGDDFEVCSS